MENIIYILKANLFLSTFYAFYFLLFRKETFHNANRYFLILGALSALFLPLFRSDKVRTTEILPQEIEAAIYEVYAQTENVTVQPLMKNYTYLDVLSFLYLTGMALAIVAFLVRVGQAILWLKSHKHAKGTAFSFFCKIFIDKYLAQNDAIVKHEHIHVSQKHFLDLIFFEMLQIVFWFNPFVYFFKKSIRIIHEFLADEEASKVAQDKIAYASLLVSKQFSIQPATIFTQHFFNHSTLKSRIIMLSKNPSKKTALLKFGLLAPLFFMMLAISSFTVVNDDKFESLYNNLNNDISQKPLEDLGFPEPTRKNLNEEIDILETSQTTESGNYDVLNFLPNNNYDGIEDLSFPIPKEDSFPKRNPNKPIFTIAEQNPEFRGGQAELYKWLAKNIQYPLEAKKNKIEGRVFVKFVIEDTGEIGEVKVMQGIGYGCDEEAVRVLKKMPKWNPAIQNGKPVAIYYNMPIVFKWQNNVVDENILFLEHEEATKNRKFSVISYPSRKNKSPKFKLGNEKINPIIIIDNEIIKDTRGIDIKMINSDYSSFKFLIPQKAIPIYGNQAKDGAVILVSKKKKNLTNIETGENTIRYSNKSIKIENNLKTNSVTEIEPPKHLEIHSQNLLNDDSKVIEKRNLLRNNANPREEYIFSGDKNGKITLTGTKGKPMVYVDGKELFRGYNGLTTLKPETIESVSVINEPAKLQLYGPRAKDGVILIKTKTNFIKTDEKK